MKLDRPALKMRRARLWRQLQPALSRTPAFQDRAGAELLDFPVLTPAQLRENYSAHNSLGLSDTRLRELADLAERMPGLQPVRLEVLEEGAEVVFLHRVVPGGRQLEVHDLAHPF